MTIRRILLTNLLFTLLAFYSHANPGKVQISFMHWGGPEEIAIIKKMVAAFESENPDIKVKIIHAANYMDKLHVMIGGGIPPDLFYLGDDNFTAFADGGALQSMEQFRRTDTLFDEEDYYELPLKAFIYNGELYGLPISWTPLVLYYNKDIFDEAGVPYPDSSWTWQDFLEAAKRMTKDLNGDGEPDQFGYLVSTWWTFTLNWIWQNGGRILSEDKTKCVMNSPETIEALQFIQDLVWKYKVAPTAAQIAQRDLFTTGRIGMVISGRWMVPRYRTIKEFEWGIAPLPKGKVRATPIFTTAYVMSKKCKYPEAAWRLARFMSGPKGSKFIAKLGLGVPSVKSVANSPLFLDPKKKPMNSQLYLEAAQYARLEPANPHWQEMGTIIQRELDLLWLNKKSAKEVCDTITEEVNKLLNPPK